MSRILAIDYGKKRTGIAVTDPMQIIASGLTTVPTHGLMDLAGLCAARKGGAYRYRTSQADEQRGFGKYEVYRAFYESVEEKTARCSGGTVR